MRSLGFIASGLEEVVAFFVGEEIADVTDGAPEVVVSACGGASDKSLELGPVRSQPAHLSKPEHIGDHLEAAVRLIGDVAEADFCVEALNEASLRDELLNEEIFDTLNDARRKLALWRYNYNAVRPHSSLGNGTPLQALRTLEEYDGSAPGALAQHDRPKYQSETRRPSL